MSAWGLGGAFKRLPSTRLNSGSLVGSSFVMSEPAAIWSSKLVIFDKSISLTQNVILSHGREALHAMIRRIDRLHAMLKDTPQIKNAYFNPDIPSTLTDLCTQQGIASNILFNDGSRSRYESERAFKLRKERVAYVSHWIKGVPVKILSDRKLRNTLTHIDEHVADALTKPKTGWMINFGNAPTRRIQRRTARHRHRFLSNLHRIRGRYPASGSRNFRGQAEMGSARYFGRCIRRRTSWAAFTARSHPPDRAPQPPQRGA